MHVSSSERCIYTQTTKIHTYLWWNIYDKVCISGLQDNLADISELRLQGTPANGDSLGLVLIIWSLGQWHHFVADTVTCPCLCSEDAHTMQVLPVLCEKNATWAQTFLFGASNKATRVLMAKKYKQHQSIKNSEALFYYVAMSWPKKNVKPNHLIVSKRDIDSINCFKSNMASASRMVQAHSAGSWLWQPTWQLLLTSFMGFFYSCPRQSTASDQAGDWQSSLDPYMCDSKYFTLASNMLKE